MKRIIKCSYNLEVIKPQSSWVYQPHDKSETIYKNLVPYVGDAQASKVLEYMYSTYYETVDEYDETVQISDLHSIQPFVTARGLESSSAADSEEMYAIKYKDTLYLANGNHRVNRMLLNGQKTVRLKIYEVDVT